MKVLIATGIYPPEVGGPAKYAKEIDTELRRRGFLSVVASYSRFGRGLPIGVRHAWYLCQLLARMQGTGLILALDTWSAGLPALIAAKLARKRIVVRIGGDFLWESYIERTGDMLKLSEFYASHQPFTAKEQVIFRGTGYLLKHADVLLFNSAWQRDIWAKAYGFAPERATVLENEFGGVQATPAAGKVFVAAARGIRYKNLLMLERVFERLKAKHPDIQLDTRVLPPQAHLERLRGAWAALVPSISEINPNTVWEGVAMGKPFVCPEESGCRERLDGLGLFVDTTSEAALEEAIERLLDEAQYQALVSRIKSFDYTHPWSRVVDEILQAAGIELAVPRVLMISGDSNVLNASSNVYQRLLLQASQVSRLDVYVRGQHTDAPLGEHGGVHGFDTSKFHAARAMIHDGTCLERVDIVTAQDPFFLGLIAWRIARRIGARLDLQVHTNIFAPEFKRRYRVQYLLAQFLLARADSIRVVSGEIERNLRRLGFAAPIFVLPVFIDEEAIRAAPPADLQRSFQQFHKFILLPARLEPEKRVEEVIRAIPGVLALEPNAGLLIAGEGSQKGELQALARELKVEHAVVFLGRRDDIYSMMKGANVVVAATATFEGFGAAAVEALAAGIPTVATRDAGVAKEAGALIPEHESLAEAIVNALRGGAPSALRLHLLSREEWAQRWRESLLPVRVEA